MAQLKPIALSLINPPALPVREGMDAGKLEELAASMREVGLLQPILVYPEGDRFTIEAGHRRYMAAQSLQWEKINCLVFKKGELALEAAKLHENLYREDITAAEEAVFYAELLQKYNLDEEGLCRLVKHSVDYVGDRFRLLRGDQEVFEALRKREINFGVARELNKFSDSILRHYYLDLCRKNGYPARQVSQWLNEARSQPPIKTEVTPQEFKPTTPEPTPENLVRCFLCGGNLDPWNLEVVHVHKWEKEQILATLRRASEG